MRLVLGFGLVGVFLLGLWWLWVTPEVTRDPSAAEPGRSEAAEVGRADSGSAMDPDRIRPAPGRRRPGERRAERARKARARQAAREQGQVTRRSAGREGKRLADARAQQGSRDVSRERAREEAREEARESRVDPTFAILEQALGVLVDASRDQQTPVDAPIDTSESELGFDEVAGFDLDGDAAASPWELEEIQKLIERARDHPSENDNGDGAYPIEQEEYGRAWEFEALDTDSDGSIDEQEYYSFLFDTLQESYLLDRDGDRQVNLQESGLSSAAFDEVDRNGSGRLQVWELRRGVGRGLWKRRSATR